MIEHSGASSCAQISFQWSGPVGLLVLPNIPTRLNEFRVINFGINDPNSFTAGCPMILLSTDSLRGSNCQCFYGRDSGGTIIASSMWAGGSFINTIENPSFTVQGNIVSGTRLNLSVLKGDGTIYSSDPGVTYGVLIQFY